jgi:hypothetical protein
VVTTTTSLIGTLLILGGLGVVMALELTCLVLNMFCISMFLGHFPNLCSMLEQIIHGQQTCIFLDLTGWVFVPTFCRFNYSRWYN